MFLGVPNPQIQPCWCLESDAFPHDLRVVYLREVGHTVGQGTAGAGHSKGHTTSKGMSWNSNIAAAIYYRSWTSI